MMQNSNTIKEQVDAKLIPLKSDTDSMNTRSAVALDNIRDIKSQADFHVRRIEKVSEIGKNLTNDINSARDQVGKLLEQLISLQTSLSTSNVASLQKAVSHCISFRLFHPNQHHSSRCRRNRIRSTFSR